MAGIKWAIPNLQQPPSPPQPVADDFSADLQRLVDTARQTERAQIVAYLFGLETPVAEYLASQISAGEHLKQRDGAKEAPVG